MRRFAIALLAAACLTGPVVTAPARAAEPVGYTAPDGVNAVAVTPTTPLPVSTPAPANVVAGQQIVSATAASLGSAALVNGVAVKARSANTGSVWVGGPGVTTADDGTGAGYRLLPGEAAAFAVSNISAIYIVGTAGDVVYFEGN